MVRAGTLRGSEWEGVPPTGSRVSLGCPGLSGRCRPQHSWWTGDISDEGLCLWGKGLVRGVPELGVETGVASVVPVVRLRLQGKAHRDLCLYPDDDDQFRLLKSFVEGQTTLFSCPLKGKEIIK